MTRRIVAALLVVFALVGFALLTHPRSNVVIVSDPCKDITPDNWFLWWYYECDKASNGGGGSGTGA